MAFTYYLGTNYIAQSTALRWYDFTCAYAHSNTHARLPNFLFSFFLMPLNCQSFRNLFCQLWFFLICYSTPEIYKFGRSCSILAHSMWFAWVFGASTQSSNLPKIGFRSINFHFDCTRTLPHPYLLSEIIPAHLRLTKNFLLFFDHYFNDFIFRA